MHLAIEVMNQAIELRQNDIQNRLLSSESKDIAPPPVCAL